MTVARRVWLTKATRDALLFAAGLVGVANEALFHHDNPSPELLVLYAGMLGTIPLLHIRDWMRGK